MNKPSEYTKADNLANEVVSFYASLLGRSGDTYLTEFSFLVEWYEAAQAAQAMAVSLRDWGSVAYFDSMVDEAALHLDLCNDGVREAA